MTQLNGSPHRRETGISLRIAGKLRPLIAEQFAGYVVLRPKGLRRGYSVDWLSVYHLGAKKAAVEARAAKKEARRGK